MEDIAIKDFGTLLKYILGLFYCLSVFDVISNGLKKNSCFKSCTWSLENHGIKTTPRTVKY